MALGAFRHAGLISNTHHKIYHSVWKKPFVNATAGKQQYDFPLSQVN